MSPPPVATTAEVEQTTATTRASPAPEPVRVRTLETVPRPADAGAVAALSGLVAGGLEAVQAEWGVDGGAVVLTGSSPFVDLTGRAGFRADGSLDGTVAMRARVTMLGLPVAEASWSVAGWTPEVTLARPGVELRGTALAVNLAELPPEAVFAAADGFATARDGTVATVDLPTGAAPPGEPLSPRIAELFRGLLGVDVSSFTVHPHTAVAGAPAFVTNTDLFFAPGMYGVDSPETARIVDAAIRAALAGAVGTVGGPPAPTPQPPPPPGEPGSVAETSVVPATVPDTTAAVPAPAAAEEAAGGATPAAGGGEAAAEGETPAEGEAPAEGEGEAAPETVVELIIPEAPTELTAPAAARGGGVASGAGGAAAGARNLPPAEENVDAARGAVEEPVAETAARAREDLAAELGAAPAPSPEIVALCERIRTAIREQRPEDEDELIDSDPTNAAQSAGGTITGSVEGQVDTVSGAYDAMATPPAGTPALTPVPVENPSPTSPGMGVDAGTAAPDPIPPENMSLDADVAATDQRIADSGIDTPVTQEIPDGPFAATRDARGELGEVAAQSPAEVAAEQAHAIETAQADMATLQQQAVAAMRASRGGTVTAVGGAQTGMVGQEVQTRESVSQNAQNIYDTAQRAVDALLQPLSRTAIARWEAGLTQLSQTFHDALDRVKRWIDDRHSGALGTLVAIGDYVGGLPDWVTDEYNRAETEFGDGVCDLLLEISTDVNGVIAAAQAIINTARDDIDAAFTAMEAEFPEWAAQERARFGGMLDSLSQRVTAAQTSFVTDVSARAVTAVNEAHAAVEDLRRAAGGLIGAVIDAINEFIDDPVRAIINGLLRVVGIPSAAFWAMVAKIEQVISDIADDPVNFINNLIAGVKLGFEQFFGNFGTWALRGFWEWLFSGLESPIPMPTEFSPRALFNFALQLMGITWPRVRQILVEHVGEQNVEIIEAAWEIISLLIERGPDGIVEMIKEQLTPEAIVQTILEAAVEYLVETLIVQVAVKLVSMLNPAGAVYQAIMAIYEVCSWIFRNAARIFRFIEAVVNGLADVVAGNIGGLANAVERALGSLIPPVIDFLAGLVGLDGLPGEVADVITRMQAQVYEVMDLIIGNLAERGRAILRSLGLGGEEGDEDDDNENDDEEVGTTVRFTAAHEAHRLWFEVNGDDATLMIASVPTALKDKIAEWRSKANGMDPPDGPAALVKINALAAVEDPASVEGDQLAEQFLAAAADQNDELEPPSDSGLENRQRALGPMLREVFELMEERDPDEYKRDIAAHIGRHGAAYAGTVRDQWLPGIMRAPRTPAGGDGGDKLWSATTLSGTATSALGFLERGSTHDQLLPYFLVGSQSNPRSASVDAFANYAFETDSPDPPHSVRSQFITQLGEATLTKLKQTGLHDVTPEENSQLRDQIEAMTFTPPGGGERWGVFQGMPGDEVNGFVKSAVRLADGVVPFLKGMATQRSAGGMDWAEFQDIWRSSQATKDWVKGEFRAVRPNAHEWIPTSEMVEVVNHGLSAVDLSPGGVNDGVKWINLFNNLRSDTRRIFVNLDAIPVYEPRESGSGTAPVPATGDAANRDLDTGAGASPLEAAGIGLHSGGAFAGPKGPGFRGTIGQKDFHENLRARFNQLRLHGPERFAASLRNNLGYELWDGQLSTSRVPSPIWPVPIGIWFRIIGSAARDPNATLISLAQEQDGHWTAIMADFDNAIAHLND